MNGQGSKMAGIRLSSSTGLKELARASIPAQGCGGTRIFWITSVMAQPAANRPESNADQNPIRPTPPSAFLLPDVDLRARLSTAPFFCLEPTLAVVFVFLAILISLPVQGFSNGSGGSLWRNHRWSVPEY